MARISDLRKAIVNGKEDRARDLTARLFREGARPRQILEDGLVAAMEEIGEGFGDKYFVPEALVAGRAFNAAMRELEPALVATRARPLGTVVIGTVKGDLHDLGKTLVKLMLRAANFRVEDLGIDVHESRFVEKVRHLVDVEGGAKVVVAISALLTTTMPGMKDVVNEFEVQGLRDQVKIIVGGAPVTEQYAREIRADGYAADAGKAVVRVKELIGLPTLPVRLKRYKRRAVREGTAPWCASALSLSELVGAEAIHRVVKDYAAAVNVSADVLSAPDEHLWAVAEGEWFRLIDPTKRETELPSSLDCGTIKRHQATGIVGNTRFCQLVQRSPLGEARCWLCALAKSFDSYRNREVTIDRCHMGLVEMRAPVRIGGYLAATMSGGQVWAPVDTRDLRRWYDELGPSRIGVSFEDFCRARDETTHRLDHARLETAGALLWQMSRFLSDMATSRAMQLVTDQIGVQTGYRTDMRTGLAFFLLRLGQLLRYSRATVWLRDPSNQGVLKIGGVAWDISLTARERRMTRPREIPVGKGLAGRVVEGGKDLLFNSRAEIEEHTEYADVAKFLRGLKSYVAVPIRIGTDIVGVIEIGIDEESAYDSDDLRVLHALAPHVGHYVRSSEEFDFFIEMLRSTDPTRFLAEVVQRLPGLVRGRGCSVFLRADPGQGPAFLAATTGLVGVSETEPVFYESGEGMTGWVLEHRKTLNLEAHADMETRQNVVREISRDAHFKSKYIEDVCTEPGRRATHDEIAQMPFLAVPLLSEDEKALGVVRIIGRAGGNFSMEDQKAVEACARLIARSHQSQTDVLRRKQAEIDSLRRADELMIGGADLREVLQAVVDGVAMSLPRTSVSIYVLDPSESMLSPYGQAGPPCGDMEPEVSFDREIFGQLARYPLREEMPESADAVHQDRFARIKHSKPAHFLGSEIVMPLSVEDRPVALLWARSSKGERLSYEDVVRIQGFAARAAGTIELSRKREELGTALETTRRELALWARVAQMGTLATGLAHEIRNPLNTITWTIEELSQLDVGEALRHRLRILARNAARVDEIIEDVLTFTRRDIGVTRRLQIGKLIEDILKLLKNEIDKAHITVVDSSHQAPDVLGNAGLVSQVFLNIILNAVQAMSPQGGTLRIVGRRTHGEAELVISDTGPGIPAAVADHIFDPFFTTKGPRGGVGLGLSLSYGIVREHGGDIKLLDDPGFGAAFSVTLPVHTEGNQ